jgi:uncharacterized membrane protein
VPSPLLIGLLAALLVACLLAGLLLGLCLARRRYLQRLQSRYLRLLPLLLAVGLVLVLQPHQNQPQWTPPQY